MLAALSELKAVISQEKLVERRKDNLLGNNGEMTVLPTTEDEIVKVVSFANQNNMKIIIEGRGTKRGFGGTETISDIVLSLENYKGIVEHTVGDMTITVKAGTTFKEIQDYLKQHKQMISLDPALPQDASLGGIIATNDSGPKRLRYGSARDLVIGLRVVYPNGTVIRTGGKVVKNVAGYDMNKLFIGSMGTLGIISEITLKLRPIPNYQSLALVSFPQNDMEEVRSFVKVVLDTPLEPVSMELLNGDLAKQLTGEECFTLAIAFEDVESSVHYQKVQLKSLLPGTANINVLNERETIIFWEQFHQLRPNGREDNDQIETLSSLKIGVKNMDIPAIIKQASLFQDLYNVKVLAHGGMGHGICHVYMKGTSEDVLLASDTLRKEAESFGGYAIVQHLPAKLRNESVIWGEKSTYHFLFEGIKRKIDPKNTLNERRFVGGI